jgi:ligand-binding sensor domain-containing protein
MPFHHLARARTRTLAVALLALASCTSDAPTRPTTTEIDPRIWAMHQAHNGDYWFGSNGAGVYRFDGEQLAHYDTRDGLAGSQVRGIYEDVRGHLLVSTTRGVSRFEDGRFVAVEFVDEPTPLEDWELLDDDLWLVFGPGERGPARYDGVKLHHMQLTESPAAATRPSRTEPFRLDLASVYSVHEDRRGHLWFGTAGHGLCRYDGESLAWMYEEHLTTTPSGGAFGIRSIFEDRHGDFWICNTRHRFAVAPEVANQDGFTVLQYEAKRGMPKAAADTDENFLYFASVAEDESGALWFASSGDGLLRLADGEVTRFALPDGAYACCVMIGQDGRVWVSTIEHGVYVLDGDRLERFRGRVG